MKFFEVLKADGEQAMLSPDTVIHFEEIGPTGLPGYTGATSTLIFDLGQGPQHIALKENIRYLEGIILRGPRAATFIKMTFSENNVVYTKKAAICAIEGLKQNAIPDKPGEVALSQPRTKVSISLAGQTIALGVQEDLAYIQKQIGVEVEERPVEAQAQVEAEPGQSNG